LSNVRYYVDEHVGNAIVHGLRRRGVDVTTVAEAGMRGRNDEAQLAFALKAGRATFTQDRDFLRLAASGIPHAGIVYAAQGVLIGTVIGVLLLIYNVLSAEEMMNNVEYI
jgi:predicted nuclease of predicted toxin-antitoxin system